MLEYYSTWNEMNVTKTVLLNGWWSKRNVEHKPEKSESGEMLPLMTYKNNLSTLIGRQNVKVTSYDRLL